MKMKHKSYWILHREHASTAITANELSEEAHVLLRHLRRLSRDGEVTEEEGCFGNVDAGGARVLPAPLRKELCQRSALLEAPRRSSTTVRVGLKLEVPYSQKSCRSFQPSSKGAWLHVDQRRCGAATALAGHAKEENCLRVADKDRLCAAVTLPRLRQRQEDQSVGFAKAHLGRRERQKLDGTHLPSKAASKTAARPSCCCCKARPLRAHATVTGIGGARVGSSSIAHVRKRAQLPLRMRRRCSAHWSPESRSPTRPRLSPSHQRHST